MSRVAPGESAGDRILTIPNVLSLLRLLSVPVFLWLFTNDHENTALVIYAVGAWTDFFDGAIARRYNQVSEFGSSSTRCRIASTSCRWWLLSSSGARCRCGSLVVLIVRDILVLGMFPLLEKEARPRIRVNFTGKTATAALFFGLTWLMWSETTFPGASIGTEIGFPFVGFGAVLYWVAGAMYAREGFAALKQEQVNG